MSVAIPEVDDLGSLRMLNRGTYLNNAFVLYEDFARSDYFPIFNIEKSRGMEDYRVLRSGGADWAKTGAKNDQTRNWIDSIAETEDFDFMVPAIISLWRLSCPKGAR